MSSFVTAGMPSFDMVLQEMQPRINLYYKQLVSHSARLIVVQTDIGLDLFPVPDEVPCHMSFSNQ